MSKPIPGNRISIYKNLFIAIFVIVFASFGFSSCISTKNSYYFKTLKKDSLMRSTVQRREDLVIKQNDLLQLNVTSLSPTEDAIYNASSVTAVPGSGNGLLVNGEGNIHLHRLGVIHVEGMTRAAIKEKLQKDLSPFLKDPIVTVSFLNHKIIVMGESGSNQVIPLPEEQMSILEMLGRIGGVAQYTRKDYICSLV